MSALQKRWFLVHQLQGSRKRVREREEGRAESGKDTGVLKSPQSTWQHLCVSFKGRCTCASVLVDGAKTPLHNAIQD